MPTKIIKTIKIIWELVKEIIPMLNWKATWKKIKNIWSK